MLKGYVVRKRLGTPGLGHSKLNIDGHYNQICQCGAIKTEIHMFLECPSICASRQMLTTNVSKILVEKNVLSHSDFAALNRAELVEILLFGHPKLSKNPSSRLKKRVCSCSKIHSFNITSPFNTFYVCGVLFVWMCVIFLLWKSLGCQTISSGFGLSSLAVC